MRWESSIVLAIHYYFAYGSILKTQIYAHIIENSLRASYIVMYMSLDLWPFRSGHEYSLFFLRPDMSIVLGSIKGLFGCCLPGSSDARQRLQGFDFDRLGLRLIALQASLSKRVLRATIYIMVVYKQTECWGGGEWRGERGEMCCKLTTSFDVRTNFFCEIDKWAMY